MTRPVSPTPEPRRKPERCPALLKVEKEPEMRQCEQPRGGHRFHVSHRKPGQLWSDRDPGAVR